MQNLKQIRKTLGLSQQRLVKLSGVSRARLQAGENGFIELRPDELASVESVLRREAEELRQFLGDAVGVRRKRQPHRRQRMMART